VQFVLCHCHTRRHISRRDQSSGCTQHTEHGSALAPCFLGDHDDLGDHAAGRPLAGTARKIIESRIRVGGGRLPSPESGAGGLRVCRDGGID
jgi:hypothetical protein